MRLGRFEFALDDDGTHCLTTKQQAQRVGMNGEGRKDRLGVEAGKPAGEGLVFAQVDGQNKRRCRGQGRKLPSE